MIMKRNHLYIILSVALLLLTSCVPVSPISEPVATESPTAVSHVVPASPMADSDQVTATITQQVEVTIDSSAMPSPVIPATSVARILDTPATTTALSASESAFSEATATHEASLSDDRYLLDFCRIPTTSISGQEVEAIYFREDDDSLGNSGWYRMDDLFATGEPVAPWGYLSRDLEYLVTFDCDGIGSICVASPPTSEPRVLSAHYELNQDPRNERSPSHQAYWLGDNKRLVFWTYTSYRNPVDYTELTKDERLYFLNVETGDLKMLDNNNGTAFVVSPVGECVLVRRETDGSAEVIALGSAGVRETLRLPDRIADVFPWLGEYDWSPDGRKIAVTGIDEMIDILDLQTMAVQTIDPCGPCSVTGLRWSPDNEKLFFTDVHDLYVVIPETESILWVGASWGVSSSTWTHWLPDGKSVVTTGSQSYGTMLYRLADDEELPSYEPLMLPDGTRSQGISDLFWTAADGPKESPTP